MDPGVSRLHLRAAGVERVALPSICFWELNPEVSRLHLRAAGAERDALPSICFWELDPKVSRLHLRAAGAERDALPSICFRVFRGLYGRFFLPLIMRACMMDLLPMR